jgi:hypothetical protein
VTIHRDGELRVRLTTQGDRIARAALGLPTVDSWLVRRLAEMLSELPEDRPGGWVSESSIAGDQGSRDGLADCLQPLLSLGIVESHSDTEGRIYYRQTGQQLPTATEVAPESTNNEKAEHLNEVYSQAFEAALSGRERIEPTDSEIVIPLGASKS